MRLWLKDLRQKRNLTQQQVAKRAGIERSFYTQIELGQRNPSVQTAQRIASVLNFNWTKFYTPQCGNETQTMGMGNCN